MQKIITTTSRHVKIEFGFSSANNDVQARYWVADAAGNFATVQTGSADFIAGGGSGASGTWPDHLMHALNDPAYPTAVSAALWLQSVSRAEARQRVKPVFIEFIMRLIGLINDDLPGDSQLDAYETAQDLFEDMFADTNFTANGGKITGYTTTF